MLCRQKICQFNFINFFVCVLISQAFISNLLYVSNLLEAGNTEITETQSLPTEGPYSRGGKTDTKTDNYNTLCTKYSCQNRMKTQREAH